MGDEQVDNQGDTQDTGSSDQQGEQQQQTPPSWYSTLDENLAKEPSVAKFKDKGVGDIVKSYVEAQKLIGKKGIIPPNEKDEADVNRFYKELGRPDSPDQYKGDVTIPDDMKQYINGDNVKAFQQMAHKYGLNQKQYESLLKEWTGKQVADIKGLQTRMEAERVQLENGLRTDWGAAYDAKVKLAKDAMAQIGGMDAEVVEKLSKNPEQVRVWANVGEKISNDSLARGKGHMPMTPAQAQEEINNILRDEDKVLYNQGHREHAARLDRLQQLYRIRGNTRG